MEHLEDVLLAQYGADIESFVPFVKDIAVEPFWGLIYAPEIVFSESLDPNYPTLVEVDSVVQQAFADPSVLDLIVDLQTLLDPGNFFTSTSAIQYATTTTPSPSASNSTLAPTNVTNHAVNGSLSPSPSPAPSSSSSNNSSTMNDPMVEDGHKIPATPFFIEYFVSRRRRRRSWRALQQQVPDDAPLDPNDPLFALTADITLTFLEGFLVDKFSTAFGLSIVDFGSMVIDIATYEPILAMAYAIEVTFAQDSAFVPTTDEIDQLIQIAFSPAAVQVLIANLQQELSPAMIQSVQYLPLPDSILPTAERERVNNANNDDNDEDGSSAAFVGVVSGAATLISIAFCYLLAMLRRRARYGRVQAFPTANNGKHAGGLSLDLMPSHSYCDSYLAASSIGRSSNNSSNNIMHFRDSTGSTTSSSSGIGGGGGSGVAAFYPSDVADDGRSSARSMAAASQQATNRQVDYHARPTDCDGRVESRRSSSSSWASVVSSSRSSAATSSSSTSSVYSDAGYCCDDGEAASATTTTTGGRTVRTSSSRFSSNLCIREV